MKNIAMFIIEIILLSALVYLLSQANGIKETVELNVPYFGIKYSLSVVITLIIAYFTGLLAGLLHSVVSTGRYKNKLKQYEKRNEKLSLKSETDSDDKEALKRKIASLEIALDNALKNK